MKRLFVTIFSFFTVVILNANILSVGIDRQYKTIQSAVNSAKNNDEIVIFPGEYNENVRLDNFNGKSLTIRSKNPNKEEIIKSTEIIGKNKNSSVFLVSNNPTLQHIFLEGLSISSGNIGLKTEKVSAEIKIDHCIFKDNNNGIMFDETIAIIIRNSVFTRNKQFGIIGSHKNGQKIPSVNISKSLFSYNGTGIKTEANIEIDNCTISENYNYGLFLSEGNGVIRNSIFYHNKTEINNSANTITISYSDICGGFPGIGNIDLEPKLCLNPAFQFHLFEGSPCIDAGDPNLIDADSTRLDMGCFSTSDYDLKKFDGNKWSWISFPRMSRKDEKHRNASKILENMKPYLNNLIMRKNSFELSHNVAWNIVYYPITSDDSFKLISYSADKHFYLPEYGTRISPDFVKPIYKNTQNMVGYWLPQTQTVKDALGSQLDNLLGIKAENWYMYKINGKWYGMDAKEATFEYGKGYVMLTKKSFGLKWHSGKFTSAVHIEPVENFKFSTRDDYEGIDIVAVDGVKNISEIGVYVDGICVGASKVTKFPVHIHVYTMGINSQSYFTFKLVSGNKIIDAVSSQKYNYYSHTYEDTPIFPTINGLSLVKLSMKEKHNYSLKFQNSSKNSDMKISVNLMEKENIRLDVYNIKGEKVKTLADKYFNKGKVSVIWDRKDDQGEVVFPGIYIFKLRVNGKIMEEAKWLLE